MRKLFHCVTNVGNSLAIVCVVEKGDDLSNFGDEWHLKEQTNCPKCYRQLSCFLWEHELTILEPCMYTRSEQLSKWMIDDG